MLQAFINILKGVVDFREVPILPPPTQFDEFILVLLSLDIPFRVSISEDVDGLRYVSLRGESKKRYCHFVFDKVGKFIKVKV